MSQHISSSVGLNLKNVKSDIFWTQITTKFGSKLQVDLLGAGWCGILPKGDWTLILPCIFDMVVFSAEDWWCFTTLIFYQIERCRHIACLHKCSFNLISNNCPLSTFAFSKNSTTAIEKQFKTKTYPLSQNVAQLEPQKCLEKFLPFFSIWKINSHIIVLFVYRLKQFSKLFFFLRYLPWENMSTWISSLTLFNSKFIFFWKWRKVCKKGFNFKFGKKLGNDGL